MTEERHTIQDPEGKPVTVVVRRDRRLKKSARWIHEPGNEIVLRVPYRLSRGQLKQLLDDIAKQLSRQHKQAKARTDTNLQKRAEYINRKYFKGAITWKAIRWVSNMEKRLGSCTNGGPTDGHIRISDRIREWPQWVIDYVIAHELTHRVHLNHSQAFWAYLQASYPLTARARGFIEGVGFAKGERLEEDD